MLLLLHLIILYRCYHRVIFFNQRIQFTKNLKEMWVWCMCTYWYAIVVTTAQKYEIDYSPQDLIAALHTFDSSSTISKVEINVANADETLGGVMDQFLMSRPWWYVIHEPYEWSTDKRIILKRFSHEMDYLLYQIASVQYPANCSHTHLKVSSTFGLESLGQYLYNMVNQVERSQWSVVIPYLFSYRKPTFNNIAYLDAEECPTLKNKVECIFLPASWCPIPSIIDDLPRHQAVDAWGKDLASIVDENRHFMEASRESKAISVEEYGTLIDQQNSHHGVIGSFLPMTTFYYYSPEHKNMTRRDGQLAARGITTVYGSFYRFNFNFRSKVAQYLAEFERSHSHLPPFPTDGNCVGAHIRRGDRVPADNGNATEWCYTHTAFVNNHTCYNQATGTYYAEYSMCHKWHDYGCHMKRTYGSVTVQEVLDISRLLKSDSQCVLLVTDDEKFVREGLAAAEDERNIYVIGAPPDHRSRKTSNGVAYFGSLAMFQRCTAFIGYGSSSVTGVILFTMCVRNGDNYGKCPPFYDFGGWF